MTILIVILVIFIWIWLYLMMIYNQLVALRNNRENAFWDIDVQLKLRFDLVPNLVESVKWYWKHEQEIYDKISEARKYYNWAKSVDDKVVANNMLWAALNWFFWIAESNPEIKANQNFLQLQTELWDIENKIAAARRFFNSSTNEYNTFLESFPQNILWWMFNFNRAQMFEISDENEKIAPKVSF